MSYVSPSLPAIPDGRISQVRFWPRPWRISKQEPSRETRDLNTGLPTPQRVPVYSCSCHGSMSTACIQPCVWVPSRSMAAECPEPLCQVQVLPAPGCLHETPRRALPLLHRSYGLMRQTNLLPSYSVPPIRRVFAGCCQSLLKIGPSRRYLCNPSIGAWTSTTGCLSGAIVRFFPESYSLSISQRTSAHPISRRNATSTANRFSRRQSFHNVQAPMVASPPGCTYRAGSTSCGQPGRLPHAMD